MSNTAPNHLHIYRDRRGKHITLDGQDLLLDGEDPMLITGMENPAEVTRVMLTLLAPKITVDSEIEDREPEPATVDAPAPTLAGGIRGLPDYTMSGDHCLNDCYDQAKDLAARVGRMETEHAEQALRIDELDQECDRQRLEILDLTSERDTALAEVERLTAEWDDRPAADLPDPADVQAGQAWDVVHSESGKATAVRRAIGAPWYVVTHNGDTAYADHDEIALVFRLVPAPRQITTREILDEAPRRTVIRDKDGVVCERASLGDGWYSPESTTDQTDYIKYPATVLWTPEVPA